eukprot:UN12293
MYLMDLGSSHGTFVNKRKLVAEQREPLRDADVIRFGASSREYIVRLSLDKSSGRSDRKRPADSSTDKRKKNEKT